MCRRTAVHPQRAANSQPIVKEEPKRRYANATRPLPCSGASSASSQAARRSASCRQRGGSQPPLLLPQHTELAPRFPPSGRTSPLASPGTDCRPPHRSHRAPRLRPALTQKGSEASALQRLSIPMWRRGDPRTAAAALRFPLRTSPCPGGGGRRRRRSALIGSAVTGMRAPTAPPPAPRGPASAWAEAGGVARGAARSRLGAARRLRWAVGVGTASAPAGRNRRPRLVFRPHTCGSRRPPRLPRRRRRAAPTAPRPRDPRCPSGGRADTEPESPGAVRRKSLVSLSCVSLPSVNQLNWFQNPELILIVASGN